jgi:hypothetical protein
MNRRGLWGLYQAESFYYSTAQGLAGNALRQAAGRKEHVSGRERLYIEASTGWKAAGEQTQRTS